MGILGSLSSVMSSNPDNINPIQDFMYGLVESDTTTGKDIISLLGSLMSSIKSTSGDMFTNVVVNTDSITYDDYSNNSQYDTITDISTELPSFIKAYLETLFSYQAGPLATDLILGSVAEVMFNEIKNNLNLWLTGKPNQYRKYFISEFGTNLIKVQPKDDTQTNIKIANGTLVCVEVLACATDSSVIPHIVSTDIFNSQLKAGKYYFATIRDSVVFAPTTLNWSTFIRCDLDLSANNFDIIIDRFYVRDIKIVGSSGKIRDAQNNELTLAGILKRGI